MVEHVARLVDGDAGDETHHDEAGDARGWTAFQRVVEEELERERSLIGPYPSNTVDDNVQTRGAVMDWGMEQDMHVISAIEVHDVFKRPLPLKDKNRRASTTTGAVAVTAVGAGGRTASPTTTAALERVPSGEKRKLLKDYVNFARMKVVRDNCQRVYGESLLVFRPVPY